MQPMNTTKTQYSEQEAAKMLGVPLEDFRTLVRTHIAHGDDVPAQATYQASDLLVLRLLARVNGSEQRLAS